MKKSNLFIFVFALIIIANNVSAYAMARPSCFVTIEVVEIGRETRQLEFGREYDSNYLKLRIKSISKGENCPVQDGQIFKAIDNQPGTFQKGDIIKAGIESASSMGPSGAVGFLQWSELTYENGNKILSKYNSAIIDNLQSENEPVSIDNSNDTQEEINIIQNDNQFATFNYYYLTTLILVVIGFLLYWFLHNRSTP